MDRIGFYRLTRQSRGGHSAAPALVACWLDRVRRALGLCSPRRERPEPNASVDARRDVVEQPRRGAAADDTFHWLVIVIAKPDAYQHPLHRADEPRIPRVLRRAGL